MSNSTRTWSTEQDAIFAWFAGTASSLLSTAKRNLVVRARAGTGKSTTIREGVNRAPERAILIAAFNKSIATDMQRQIKNPRVEVKTLHGLGFKFIARNWKVKVDENKERAKDLATRAAPDDAPVPMIQLIADLHTKAREIEPFIALKGRPSDLIDIAVQFNLVPDEEWETQKWTLDRVCECAFNAMKLAMERTPIIDFADMIFLPLVHKWVKPWYQMVVVDEAQDMTKAQLALATQCCTKTGRICIVGDDCQAIYAFRGADSGSLNRLKKTLDADELGLTTTYRCAKNIVNLAKVLVPDFKHAPSAPDGVIANCDQEKMLTTAREGDFILSQTTAPLVRICMALLKQGRRARIKGRDIGRGVIALIRKLGESSIIDLLSALTAHTERETARAMKLPEAAQEERLNFICDQADIIRELSEGCIGVSDLIARCQDLFADDAEKQSIMCSTVHRAKGLEADNTFLLEGTFRKGRQEEDNIRYVAITRAKTRLTWVSGYGKDNAKPDGQHFVRQVSSQVADKLGVPESVVTTLVHDSDLPDPASEK